MRGGGFCRFDFVEFCPVLHNLQLCSIWGLFRPLKTKILKESFEKEIVGQNWLYAN
jgi:hypothetical protein